ncbi:vigilin [Nephila pilipes]|uniref:Vigilin n=1 Tax=Nephila pilipes TaxID=299642 RepID=A0A8X6QW14_NEPPI|nr:vigilin [Nephila pilipes]
MSSYLYNIYLIWHPFDPADYASKNRLIPLTVNSGNRDGPDEKKTTLPFSIIGAKGEKIREIRDKFNQVNITFSKLGLKSDKVSIRGPKSDVAACYKYLHRMNVEMKITNLSVEEAIYKQNHKFLIRKSGENIKKINDETNTKLHLPAEGAESDAFAIRGPKVDVMKAKERLLEI